MRKRAVIQRLRYSLLPRRCSSNQDTSPVISVQTTPYHLLKDRSGCVGHHLSFTRRQRRANALILSAVFPFKPVKLK
jgi:hypothetical protein